MASSALDSNTYSLGLQRALDIKGKKNAPNLINTDEIMVIANAIQDGFAIKEAVTFNQSEAITTGTEIIDIELFSPVDTIFGKDNVRNNRLWENRILAFSASVSGQGSGGGANYFRLRFRNITDGTLATIVQMKGQKDVDPALFNIPAITIESTGIYETNVGMAWNGYIPAGISLNLEYDNVVNLSAGTVLLDFVGYRVPRGAQLPL